MLTDKIIIMSDHQTKAQIIYWSSKDNFVISTFLIHNVSPHKVIGVMRKTVAVRPNARERPLLPQTQAERSRLPTGQCSRYRTYLLNIYFYNLSFKYVSKSTNYFVINESKHDIILTLLRVLKSWGCNKNTILLTPKNYCVWTHFSHNNL